jgi:phospholipid transport system transporter-binding protein
MMRLEEGVAWLEGELTLGNASGWLREGETALQQGIAVFDLAGIGQLDSSALSLLLSLRRRAEAAGSNIEFRNIPDSLASLAKLYGVADQI